MRAGRRGLARARVERGHEQLAEQVANPPRRARTRALKGYAAEKERREAEEKRENEEG